MPSSVNRGAFPSVAASASVCAPLVQKQAERSAAAAVELHGVSLRLSGGLPDDGELLCWHGRAGEIVKVVGSSQEQRRRLLAVMAGRLPASAGRLVISGHDLEALPRAEHRSLCYRVVGSVLPGDVLFPHFNLRENVALPLLVGAVPDALALEKAQSELDRLGLADFGDALPALVGASQSRLARIARALVHGPRLCVMDAPEESLSDEQLAMLRERLWQAARVDGACIVLSTDHPRLAGLADTVLPLPTRHSLQVRT